MAEDLVTVDAQGRAHWNRSKDEILLGDLIRAADLGLLHGDPLRPYLVLVLPQGDAGSAGGWDALLAGWQLIEHALAVRDVALLLGPVGVAIKRRLRGRKAVTDQHGDLLARGGSASAVRDTLERGSWKLADLRMIMNLPSEESAEKMLDLFGFSRNADGEFALGDEEEARLLRLAEDEVFYTLRLGLEDEHERLERLKTLFRTGEPPPPIEL